EQFTVDEAADAAEAETDGGGGGTEIGNLPKIPAPFASDVPRCKDHADEYAIERHAALPDREDGERLTNVGVEIIEENVIKSASDHDAQDQIEQQIVQIVRGDIELAIFRQAAENEEPDDERQHVHQPVPSELHWADAQEDRIDI